MKTIESVRERAFLEHPDALLDPVKAAVEVGYSESNARNRGYELRKLHLPALLERMRTRLEKLSITPEWVKNEVAILANTAMADFIEFIEHEGQQVCVLKPGDKIDRNKWRAAIKEAEFDTLVTADGVLKSRLSKLKLYDRQAALVELANLLGMKNEAMFTVLNAPSQGDSDAEKLLEFMTEEELETMADIQERAAARMRRKASDRRDASAIDSTSSEAGGSKNHSTSGGPRTIPKRKAVRLPPTTPPIPKD